MGKKYKPENTTRPHTHPKRMNKLTGSPPPPPPPARVFFFPFSASLEGVSFILFCFPFRQSLCASLRRVFFSLHLAHSKPRLRCGCQCLRTDLGLLGAGSIIILWCYRIYLCKNVCFMPCSSDHIIPTQSSVWTRF